MVRINHVFVLIKEQRAVVSICYLTSEYVFHLAEFIHAPFQFDTELIEMVNKIEETLSFNIPDFAMRIELTKSTNISLAIRKIFSFLNSGDEAISSRLNRGKRSLHYVMSEDGLETAYSDN